MSSPARQFCPGRLWSLRDMLKINAQFFYDAAVEIKRGQVLMPDFPTLAGYNPREPIEKDVQDGMLVRFNDVRAALCQLGVPITLIALDDFIRKIERKELNNKMLIDALSQIEGRLGDELSLIELYVLDANDAKYCEPKEPLFGPQVAANFLSAQYEIDEAGKCYALDRSTATVFHLMRIMEIAIRAIARCLQIPDPIKPGERNWGHILKAVKDGIDTKWPTTASRHGQPDPAFFESIYVSLDAVRNPWRNATMHIETIYTKDEAKHIFDVVGGFMRKIASRMDERGDPKA